MKAIELHEPAGFRLRHDLSIPTPGPGEVRVRVLAAGICGTDVHICKGDPSIAEIVEPPIVLGHEFCGTIDALGKDVTNLSVGQYVSAEMHEVCHACPACRDGAFHACANTKIRGVNLDGAFADHVIISATNIVVLPDTLPHKVGAILDPLGNAVHTACKVPLQDKTAAIVGYGPIGAMCAEVALFVGARHIFILDVKEQPLERACEWIRRTRSEDRVTVLDARDGDVTDRVIHATEGGVDVSMEISGHPDGINNAIRMIRAAGHLVQLGLPRTASVSIDDFSNNIIFKGLTIHAIIGREIFATWDRMLELLAKGLDVEHLVTCELPLEEFEHGMTRFGEGLEGKVILYPDEACQGG